MTAIDIGSNTFRVLQMRCDGTTVCEFEKIIRLAQGLHEGDAILPEAKARLFEAFNELASRIDTQNEPIRAVATAAMRKAVNAADIVEEAKARFGITIEIINADEEAGFARAAVSNRLAQLQFVDDDFVLFDIGGGSSEIVFVQGDKFDMKSFDFGIVTLAESVNGDAFEAALSQKMAAVEAFVQRYYEQNPKPMLLIPTAGTPTTMAAFLQGMQYTQYDVRKINGFTLTLEDCNHALRGLLDLDDETRKIYVGEGREDLIIAGVKIVMAFYEALGFTKGVVIDDGVREGVLASMCKEDL